MWAQRVGLACLAAHGGGFACSGPALAGGVVG